MPDRSPSFPVLVQRFFVDHLRQQRAVSSCTIAAYPHHDTKVVNLSDF